MAKVQSHRLARAPARAPAGLPHALPGGLIYVSDALLPGITRRGNPGSFSYLRSDGRPLDAADLERIRGLAIPPAYREVWICPWPSGHLQATARDARGRKQYRYHASWSALRNADKFDRIEAFGRALPAIRRRVVAEPGVQLGQQNDALKQLGGMYGTDVGAQLGAQRNQTADINAAVQAGNSGWLQNTEGVLDTAANLGKAAGSVMTGMYGSQGAMNS